MSSLKIVPDGFGCFDVNQNGERIAGFTSYIKAEKFIDNKRSKKNAEFTDTPAA